MIGMSSFKAIGGHTSKYRALFRWLILISLALICVAQTAPAGITNYTVRGVIKDIKKNEQQLVIAHETIPHFMEAMTMPFHITDPALLTNLTIGQQITFRLRVTDTESWIDQIESKNGSPQTKTNFPALGKKDPEANFNRAGTKDSKTVLREFKFTNELGQPVSLSDFRGKAIALTFFFTRCPIPEFCPRLSRNFQAVQQRLKKMENAPTNWHLLSVTFDPAFDTPDVLKTYGASYQYDPEHWSFLTGPASKIAELAKACDVQFDPDKNGLIDHNFRTLIIDSSNRLQMVFPTSGDISESIVQELIKAAGETNQTVNSISVRPKAEK
jgi:protein SCO1